MDQTSNVTSMKKTITIEKDMKSLSRKATDTKNEIGRWEQKAVLWGKTLYNYKQVCCKYML